MKAVHVIIGFLDKLRKDRVGAYAAQTALFILMSAIPLLMLLLSAVQYIPVTRQVLESGFERYLPASVQPFVLSVMQEVYSKSITILSITVVVSLWISAKGMQALADGLNSVYGIEETRPWIVLRLRAVFNTLLMLAAIIIMMLLIVFGKRLETLLVKHVPFLGGIMSQFVARRLFLSAVMLMLVFDIFYVVIPNRRATLLGQLPGAMFCTISWLVFSYGVSIYINYFNGFSMYGSLTALVIIMFWLYFCMYFLLLGGAINYYFNAMFRKIRMRLRMRRREKKRAALEEKGNSVQEADTRQ